MLKLLSGLFSLFVYFCCGTLLVEIGIVAFLWKEGIMTAERNQAALRAIYGLERTEIAEQIILDSLAPTPRSYDDIRQIRLKVTLNQDLRESCLTAGDDDLKYIEEAFEDRKRRFSRLKNTYDARNAQLKGAASDDSIVELRNLMAAMQPDQASDLFVTMLDKSRQESDPKFRNDMVTILKSLPAQTQKKLLAEFQAEEKSPYLLEMLNQIRLGMPDISVVRDTRKELQNYSNRATDNNSGVP